MAGFSCVHHFEIGAIDGPKTAELFTQKYSFELKAIRKTDYSMQWLLVANDAKLVITSVSETISGSDFENDPYITDWMTAHAAGSQRKNSVFNIAFKVKNVGETAHRATQQNVQLLKQPQTLSDKMGSVKTCVIKSCIGDVVHTLVESSDYSGEFLPGFEPVNINDTREVSGKDSGMLFYDHVALAVPMGGAASVIDWYERCLGMKRFLINSDEDVNDGLVLSSKTVGLRLRAMEWWKCAETGLLAPNADSDCKVYMVIAEGLPPVEGQTEENQIEYLIREHGCPGVQHIAFRSNDVKFTTQYLKARGVAFARPPPDAYYERAGRLDDIERAGEDAATLKKHGILIDTECDAIDGINPQNRIANSKKGERYLLQIFTAPMFDNYPFFIEFIQRQGATGFGSGNIAALYRSVQYYFVGKKKAHALTSSNGIEAKKMSNGAREQ